MLIEEKINQAIAILNEIDIDCWITFVRESSILHDPMLDFLIEADVTWHSAFIITKKGDTYAIVGQMEKQTIEDMGVYMHVFGYVEGVKNILLDTLQKIDPASIALNYSTNSEICDGLTHGMYLTLYEYLSAVGFEKVIVSSEKITSSLKARKTPFEVERIKTAIANTLDIFSLATSFIQPGKSEKEIADFMIHELEKRNLEPAWEKSHCPAVFTGPDTAEAHYKPTDRKVERGHVLNMDFGVKFENYCSDMQRTFYILEKGEIEAPSEVLKGFDTIVKSIELAKKAIKPGVRGVDIDTIAREYIVSQGYEEFPHGLGHQVGRFAHDGTALLGPAWEKYARKPFIPLEEGMIFTIEPRLTVPGRGVATVEEMIVIRKDGAEFLAEPQKKLILVN